MTLKILLRQRFACRMFPGQKLFRLLLLLIILAVPAFAQSRQIGEVHVEKRYVRIRVCLQTLNTGLVSAVHRFVL